MSIVTLQKQIEAHEGTLASLRESQGKLAQCIAGFESGRTRVVVAARTGDAAAKAKLREIDEGISTARRELADDGSAIAALSAELETFRSELETATKQAKRDQLCKLVDSSLASAESGPARIVELTQELKQAMDALASSANQIDGLLRGFDKTHLESVGDSLRISANNMRVFIEAKAKTIEELTASAKGVFLLASSAVNSVRIPGERKKSTSHQLYEALDQIGIAGRRVAIGEKLWLTPAEAADLLQSGVLRECEVEQCVTR
ncbi:MAG: hypothetical protein LAO20_10335 [Acidobacteriia bacterium]|nr:hypothetical protein [Terriglobia bacterium]